MQKKEFMWIALLLVLAYLYVHFFTNWFSKGQLSINASLRPAMTANADVESVIFNLNGQYQLKSLQVFELENDKFNPHGHQLWHLISDKGSAPTQVIVYGRNVRGMKLAPDSKTPEGLQPDVHYRILITAGGLTGFTDFHTVPEQ